MTHKLIDKPILLQSLARRCELLPGERREKIISHIISLYEGNRLLADSEFNYAFLNGDAAEFQQRYWELSLADHLRQIGVDITRKRFGPDFGFELEGKKIWIEAIAPNTTDAIDEYYRIERLNRGGWFSADIFHLRWTQAINDKAKKYSAYRDRGWVGPADICIIAINAALLGSLGMMGKSDYPAPIDVLFGIGPEYVVIRSDLMTIVDHGHKEQSIIVNKNDSDVSKRFFFDNDARHISAILASATNPEMQTPLIAIHNPFAQNRLQRGKIRASFEYHLENCGEHFEMRMENRPTL